jgi:hypothetical protein
LSSNRLSKGLVTRYKVEALFGELQQQIKPAPRAIATILECGKAVSPRGHGPESEKVGAAPGSKAIARTQHDLTVSEIWGGSRRALREILSTN